MAAMVGRGFEHFHHMADVGVRGRGPTPAAAFEEAARAMIAAVADLDQVAAAEPVAITCSEADRELLLVDWLNALIFEMETRRMVFGRFEVAIAGAELTATAWGEPLDQERHHVSADLKGATYTELRVAQESDGSWIAQCVVDV